MQGERITVGSLPETFEFDLGSASNSSVLVDSQVCWNNALNGQNLANYLLSPDQSLPPFEDAVNVQGGSLNDWDFRNTDSARRTTTGNDDDTNESKMELAWTSGEAGPSNAAGLRLHERRSECNDGSYLENAAINGTSNQANTELELFHNLYGDNMQGLDSNSEPHYSIINGGLASNSARGSEAGSSNSFRNLDNKQAQNVVGPSNSFVTSSGDAEHALEDGDSRRLSRKRKNIGGVPGQSFFGASSSSNQSEGSVMQANPHHNPTGNLTILSPSDSMYGASSAVSMGTRVGAAASSAPLENNSAHSEEDAENSRRNFRLRINSPVLNNPSPTGLLLRTNSVSNHDAWYHPLSSLLPPPSHGRPAMTMNSQVQSQAHLPIIPGLPQHVPPALLNTDPISRAGGSLEPPVSDRFGTLREEINMGSLLPNSPEPPLIIGPSNVHASRRASQIYLGLSGTNMSLQGNMTPNPQLGSAPGNSSLMNPTMIPIRNASNQHQLSLELIRQSISTAHSNFAGPSNDVQLQRSTPLGSVHTPIPIRGVRLRGQPQLRFPALMDRQNDTSNGDVFRTLAARERRTRMLSEIRNMLGALRMGDNLRFEDLILDHSVLVGAGDLHDRHRDMRLDVDNMSYEELLALEERIGNVSTGLNEEAVSKCLKQQKHSASTVEGSPEVEPCCICQEEYVEGEDVGRLNCGHDFHTACVKQWLAQKNMCPICKIAALVIRDDTVDRKE